MTATGCDKVQLHYTVYSLQAIPSFNTMTALDKEGLISSLKRLVISFGPFIQNAGSVEQAEESLLHMEANDENFHKYEFVQWLRSHIDSQLGPLIDREMGRHSITPQEAIAGQQTVIDKITEKIISSPDFRDMTERLKMRVTDACEHLVTNFPQEFTPEEYKSIQQQLHHDGRMTDPGNCISDVDVESSLGESSLNQSTFMFMNNEQFERIVNELQKKQPLEMRKVALQSLLQTSSVDVVNSEWWSHIRQGLVDALTINDTTLWPLALKFIARGFSTNSHNNRELYTTLLEYMIMQFNISNKNNIPKLQDGLDCVKPECERLLRAFRLMNEFQQQVPQYWIRYPDKFLDEVQESTLSLLSMQYTAASGSASQVTPIHLLALFDANANWFIKWMHGHYSRQPLLEAINRHKAFLESAVRSIIDFMNKKQNPNNMKQESPRGASSDPYERRMCYTSYELEFIHFVHSVHIISRVLCYSEGRNKFPLKVKGTEEPVTVTSLLVILLQVLTAPNATTSYKLPAVQYDPGLLVTDVFKKLCVTESSCRHCVCVDVVTDALLAPVTTMIKGEQNSHVGEATLLQIADILSAIASCSVGRQHLLYGQQHQFLTTSKSAPVHQLAEFTRLGMLNKFSDIARPSQAVLGNFAYVCRQLYTTCEGLYVLSPYNLHVCISKAWREAVTASDGASTPTPSIEERQLSPGRESTSMVLWEDILRDTLLNFAGTPKGLSLLEQNKALMDCVYYMYSRQAQRLQVSKYEKYGYGYMISQVAATAPGMQALLKCGFISSLVKAIWGTVEIVFDHTVQPTHSWPVVPDKFYTKNFNNMVSLMSSFCGVYEVLCGQKLPNKAEYSLRDFPTSIPGLLDRLVFVDSAAKMHSLFNYEESHYFGLRMLSVLTSCLDTMLLLQTQYCFQDVLLAAQKESTSEDSSAVIVDALSLERNYILVKSHLIGGPTERIMPQRFIPASGESSGVGHPLFTAYPVPKQYIPTVSSKSVTKQDTELSKYLADTKKSDLNQAWLEKCKKAFCSVLTTKPDYAKGPVLQELLEKCTKVLSASKQDACFPLKEFSGNDSLVKNFKLSPLQDEGIKVAVRYGQHLRLLSNKDVGDRLTYLIKQTCYFLKQQHRPASASSLLVVREGYPGFDWFVATIFLLMEGQGDRAWRLLHQFSTLTASAYLWRARLHNSVHQPDTLGLSGIPPMLSSTCHYVELILQMDVAHVHSAFKMSGFAPSQICQQWLSQCFWTYLDWIEVCHYVSVCLLLGVDYQVYICVAILKFLQTDILHHMQQQDLISFLKEEPIRGFKVGEHLEYMQQLERKFRKSILPDMLEISKP